MSSCLVIHLFCSLRSAPRGLPVGLRNLYCSIFLLLPVTYLGLLFVLSILSLRLIVEHGHRFEACEEKSGEAIFDPFDITSSTLQITLYILMQQLRITVAFSPSQVSMKVVVQSIFWNPPRQGEGGRIYEVSFEAFFRFIPDGSPNLLPSVCIECPTFHHLTFGHRLCSNKLTNFLGLNCVCSPIFR